MRRLIYVDGIPENHKKNSRQITLDQTRLTDYVEATKLDPEDGISEG